MILVDMVGIVALVGLDLRLDHPGIDQRALAEAFIDARPARVAAEVNDGVEHPRAVRGTALVSRDLGHGLYDLCIERGTDVDRLGEKRTSLRISHAVIVIQAVKGRNTEMLD